MVFPAYPYVEAVQPAAITRQQAHAPARFHATRETARRFAPSLAALPLVAQAGKETTNQAGERLLNVVQQGGSLYATGALGSDLAAAVGDLVSSFSSAHPGPESLSQGQGTWEVFYAPHIARLSAALGARFEPIRYTLRGDALISNVRYSHPLLGTGWLSASGTLAAEDDTTLLLNFDRFWVDFGADALRPELPPPDQGGASGGGSSSSSGGGGMLDSVVSALGRAAFLPGLARFPVEYLDGGCGLAVFRFPPLASSIAVVRTSTATAAPQAVGVTAADAGTSGQ